MVISFSKRLAEKVAKDNKAKLYIGGGIITFLVVLAEKIFNLNTAPVTCQKILL